MYRHSINMFIAVFCIVTYFQLRLGGVVPCSELIVSNQMIPRVIIFLIFNTIVL